MSVRNGRTLRMLGAWLIALTGSSLSCAQNSRAPAIAAAARFGPVAPPLVGVPLLAASAPNASVIAMDAGVAGDRVSGLLEIPADQCAVIIARAGTSVEDVDLFAYGKDGSVVGTDEGPDNTPALLVCPPHPRRVWVAARIAAGHGLVAVGAQNVAPSDALRAARAFGIRTADPNRADPRTWPGLDEKLEAHRREIGARWQDVRRVAIPLDARIPTRVSAQIDAGRCLDAFVAPPEEAGHLELTALDASGAIVARAASSGRERSVILCSPLEAVVAFEIRPLSGRGSGVLVLSKTSAGSEADLETEPTRLELFPRAKLDAELAELDASLAVHNAYAKGRVLASGALEVGRRNSASLSLPAGCSRIDVVGGEPLRGIDASIWSANGSLVSRARAGGRAMLFACGPKQTARIDLEATLRPGPFALLLHAESEVPAALVSAPLAAGRLLEEVVSRGVLRRASEMGQALEFSLSESEIKTLDLTVPFGRCVDVALALDSDAIGAEIRLVTASHTSEIALARGAHATSARVCSLDAASAENNLKTRAELRVVSGSSKALVATRMLSPTR